MARTENRGSRHRRDDQPSGKPVGPAQDAEDNAPDENELRKHRPNPDEVERMIDKE